MALVKVNAGLSKIPVNKIAILGVRMKNPYYQYIQI
jgi:hypothetical protein